jgi:precorrin-6B methylase 2
MLVKMDQIEFVGDLSLSDARELARLGSGANNILEFGVGGSTQIFAQCCPKIFVSIDTDRAWIERTSENLKKISHEKWTVPWLDNYPYTPDQFFDLIFVDGHPSKRLDFAMQVWSHLKVGGKMVFHDTRRFEYFRELAWVMQSFFKEVSKVEINVSGSNLSVITKCAPVHYENWNFTENKPMWAYGAAEMPEGEALCKIGV